MTERQHILIEVGRELTRDIRLTNIDSIRRGFI
jgi:hypothetical protein